MHKTEKFQGDAIQKFIETQWFLLLDPSSELFCFNFRRKNFISIVYTVCQLGAAYPFKNSGKTRRLYSEREYSPLQRHQSYMSARSHKA